MRTIVLVCLFTVAATAAVLPEASYFPPAEKVSSEYLPPSDEVAEVKEAIEEPLKSAALAEDGYLYKTVRKLKFRQRRDVSELSNEYLPPSSQELSSEYIPPAEVKEAAIEESAVLADDGYQYKTVRKLKYRQRRDVSEIVSPQYLPPSTEALSPEYIPPAELKEAVEETETPEESAVLGDDGYQYKTIRKLKYRQRRDVSEIAAPQYLPPSTEELSSDYIPPAEVKEAVEQTEAPEESAVLADDGYQYKTIRTLKYRQRRDVSEIVSPQYLPPSTEAISSEYIPPAELKEAVEETEAPEESAVLGDDGYQYKTIRKLKYRQRRDVSEIVAPEYLPPSDESAEVKEAVEATKVPEDSAVLADDGYQYKTIRTLKYRQRRDVSEIVSPQYLPPPTEAISSEYIPPTELKEAVEETEAPEESAVLGDDGYQYKTIRKLKYRQRRDVSEIVSPQYLPPSTEALSSEYIPPAELKEAVEETEAPEESAVLGDDGYQYKTIRKLKYRQRRDVSEIVSPQYLPPSTEALSSEYIPPAEVKEAKEETEAPEESAALADDGYRYKTIRKLKYRQRRDVSEIVAPEYLPPSDESAEVKEAAASTEALEDSAVLADDGYQYKTIRKLKYRQRRDVSEIVSPQYLPPSTEALSSKYIPPAELKEAVEETETPEESAVLGDDGYQYKTIRKLKYRQRRDVSEIAAPQYLPPSTEELSSDYIPPAEVKEAVEQTEAPEESAVLADDGYQYKTIRKLKYRQRRDVSEIVSPQYLPPSTEELSSEYIPPAELKEAVEQTETPEESAVLADDGYQYKTVRKLKYRQRRDVSEIVSPQYLPPSTEELSSDYIPPAEVKEAVEQTEAPEESAVLADDGYQYKTIRKLKYRQRRDVSEIVASEYLPPSDESAEVKEAVEATEAPEDSAVLAADGYQYKTIRKLKYRHRRDVSEIVSPQYLPPSTKELSSEYIPPAEVKEAVEETVAPEESAVLGDDGYQYKTIRKLKYRQRRDVSEIVSPQYLPPSDESAEVKEAVEATEAPEDSAVLADDGYQYKTIRKLKYRQRRDVSEIVAPKYLPPIEKSASEYLPPSVEEVADVTEIPAVESAILNNDGYQYKTVKRIRYRH